MKLQYSTFIMPHIGDHYSQCADRFAIGKENHCFAIADGVGASFFPEVWAELVSKDFVDYGESFENNNVLVREEELITRWNDSVEEKVSNLTDTEKFLIEMSRERCDFAACTFVGLSIDHKQWHCKALGDSYLFVLDEEFNIINSVASQKGLEFDNFPEYFASVHGKNNGMVVSESGDMTNVAYLVLLTDAISDWFIKSDDINKRKSLITIQNMDAFRFLIDAERANGKMKDDDTTAVIIRVVPDESEAISVEEIYNTDINQFIKEGDAKNAEQEAERLAKKTEETARQEQPLQIEEPKFTIVETPPVEMIIENVELKTLQNDTEPLSAEELSRFIQTAKKVVKNYIDNFAFPKNENKKAWRHIKNALRSMQKNITEIDNKLNKIQH